MTGESQASSGIRPTPQDVKRTRSEYCQSAEPSGAPSGTRGASNGFSSKQIGEEEYTDPQHMTTRPYIADGPAHHPNQGGSPPPPMQPAPPDVPLAATPPVSTHRSSTTRGTFACPHAHGTCACTCIPPCAHAMRMQMRVHTSERTPPCGHSLCSTLHSPAPASPLRHPTRRSSPPLHRRCQVQSRFGKALVLLRHGRALVPKSLAGRMIQ